MWIKVPLILSLLLSFGSMTQAQEPPLQPVDCESPLATVYFDFEEGMLRADQTETLAQVFRRLDQCVEAEVVISGHTDERRTEEYNLAIGERRAASVERHLERLGVDPDRMETVSYGEGRPLCTDHDESCWARNRRVEIEWR